ncbi:4635_t:CDS:2 [Cetraspora pellucida]|uniref:4635_t:CDS:1 n=1 Tax=Cetraspora pellucida TaxID=1433469 RepID=A0ACA9KQM3_9GLOM|nr:4635_t:CDS:2 [Cetraspora pellucida]
MAAEIFTSVGYITLLIRNEKNALRNISAQLYNQLHNNVAEDSGDTLSNISCYIPKLVTSNGWLQMRHKHLKVKSGKNRFKIVALPNDVCALALIRLRQNFGGDKDGIVEKEQSKLPIVLQAKLNIV